MDISLTLTPQKTYAFPSLGLISAHKPTSLRGPNTWDKRRIKDDTVLSGASLGDRSTW